MLEDVVSILFTSKLLDGEEYEKVCEDSQNHKVHAPIEGQ